MIEVAVIANNKEYARSLANNLEIYFGDNIKFNYYGNVDFESIEVFNEDFLILSAFTVFQAVKYRAKESAKINIITLTLDKEYVKNLYKIPQESRAYLVNIDYRNCMEVITMLYDIGFNRLDLVPFYPGCEYDDTIKIAITPAELSLVPREITTIIDIGHRKIDLNSVYRIAKTLDVEISTSSEIIAAALERQVNYYPEMEKLLNDNNGLLEQLNAIIRLVNQGIIITDHSGKIYIVNDSAKDMLKEKTALLIGFNINEVFPEIAKLRAKNLEEIPTDMLIDVKHQKLTMNISKINNEEKTHGFVIMLESFKRAEDRHNKLRSELMGYGHEAKHTFESILGRSKEIQEVKAIAKRMAQSDSSVCLFGESGTGKELFAQSIHNYSKRRTENFVAINCSALPENLLESELYGYEDGAFTGAKKGGKIGLFELAHKGTLFLDEIGELPMQMQSKLLRVLEERKILRVGGQDLIDVDVRIICATNRDLKKMIKNGEFRQDLYYRICVLPIHIPPLRMRKEDIIDLKQFYKGEMNCNFVMDDAAQNKFISYQWPGNIRELKNIVEYLSNLQKEVIEAEDIPFITDEYENNSFSLESVKEVRKIRDVRRFVLETLEQYQKLGKCIGRQNLLQIARENNKKWNEQDIRRELSSMCEEGYVIAGKGRQGSKITEKGVEYLLSLQ